MEARIYTATRDGEMFRDQDSTYSEPRVFITGTESVIPGITGINRLVIGMTVGESRTHRLSPDLAFGPYHSKLVCRVGRGWLQAQNIADANHRLAGKRIAVQLDLLEILDSVTLRIPSTRQDGPE